jgi:alpha-ribazole phosphatase
MELYLVRHTRPDVQPGICYGHADIDVSETFHSEADTVRNKLAGIAPTAFYTSPQQRCRKLAATLPFGLPQEDVRLKELHFGEWELLAWDAIPRDALDHWGNRFVEVAPPGGESFTDLFHRAKAFFSDCANRHQGPVVAVTHAGVIRALLAHALNLPLQHVPNFQLDFGGITKLTIAGPYIHVNYVNR